MVIPERDAHVQHVGTCSLAKRFPDIAFLQLNIEANPRRITPNDAAAWDAVRLQLCPVPHTFFKV